LAVIALCISSSSASPYDKINVVQAHSASGLRYEVSVTHAVSVRKSGKNRYVFIRARNDAKVGADVTQSGRAFQVGHSNPGSLFEL